MKNDNSTNKHLRKGVIWTLINRTSVVVMQFIAMIVLARFISPADFAIMGIAMFFISISQTLLDSGMGGSLLRKQKVEDADYSTLFLYNMGVGTLMYLFLLLSAEYLAVFYNYEELSFIINVIGVSIVISAFGKIQSIILYRELKFREISIISIISSAIALLIAVIMAINGYGVWALVMQNLINCLFIVVLQFLFNQYFPPLKFSKSSFKEQWNYGSHLLYSQVLSTLYQNIFSIIFPKISTYAFAGLYAQANKIQQVPASIINSVVQGSVFPILAKIEDEQLFIQTNKAFNRKIYIFSFFVLFALSVFSKQFVVLLLGQKWADATPILSILSVGGVGVVVSMLVRNSLKSMGITNDIFKIEIIKSLIGIFFLIVTFLLGSYYILIGMVISNLFSSFISIYYFSKMSKVTVKEQIKDLLVSLLPIIPSVIISCLFVHFSFFGNVSTLFFGLLIYTFFIVLFGHIFQNREIMQVERLVLLKLRMR